MPPGRSVTARALALLAAFEAGAPALTLSELADRSGLPLTTAHRLARELTAWGALERQPDGTYAVGRRLWSLGLLAPVSRVLRDVAMPVLQDIAATTGENAHLAVRDGTSALYVERLSGVTSVPIVSRSGSRLPLHATAVGKVLLAHAPEDVLQAALRSPRRVTEYTVVEPGRLLRQLAGVRRRGYALTGEEMTLGTSSVAVPVTDEQGRVQAAVGVVVAASRRDLVRLVPVLQVAARTVSRAAFPDGR